MGKNGENKYSRKTILQLHFLEKTKRLNLWHI